MQRRGRREKEPSAFLLGPVKDGIAHKYPNENVDVVVRPKRLDLAGSRGEKYIFESHWAIVGVSNYEWIKSLKK